MIVSENMIFFFFYKNYCVRLCGKKIVANKIIQYIITYYYIPYVKLIIHFYLTNFTFFTAFNICFILLIVGFLKIKTTNVATHML
jgi:hypothetical protein